MKEEAVRAFLNSTIENTFLGISQLDEEAAETVLKNTCKACVSSMLTFLTHNYGYDPEKPDLDAYIAADEKMEKLLTQGQASIIRDGNTIIYTSKSGHCVCPLVKDYKIVQAFPNLCLCTKNCMTALYEAAAKRPVNVEIVEAYNRGGNSCTLKIELL